jgi:hypothetical protein
MPQLRVVERSVLELEITTGVLQCKKASDWKALFKNQPVYFEPSPSMAGP